MTGSLWLAAPSRSEDLHVGFRAAFHLDRAVAVSIRLLGASWYAAYLDGQFLIDGPPRIVGGVHAFRAARAAPRGAIPLEGFP